MTVADAGRARAVTEVADGLRTNHGRRRKDLGRKNQRLGKAVADLTLDTQILAEAARGA